jgi:hypothetical protein
LPPEHLLKPGSTWPLFWHSNNAAYPSRHSSNTSVFANGINTAGAIVGGYTDAAGGPPGASGPAPSRLEAAISGADMMR